MVSQGRRQFEGLPKEDSGAEGFRCSTINTGDNQNQFGSSLHAISDQFSGHSLHDGKHSDEDSGASYHKVIVTSSQDGTHTLGTTQENSDLMFSARKEHDAISEGANRNENTTDIIEHDQAMHNPIKESDLNSFALPKDTSVPTAPTNHSQEPSHSNRDRSTECQNKDNSTGDGSSQQPAINLATHINNSASGMACMAPVTPVVRNSQVMSCDPQPISSSAIVCTSVSSHDPTTVSVSLRPTTKMSRLTLDSDSQLLLSGVQTIPEQVPLILTEGDAEEHESLTVMTGTEQLQGVSTQAVLGGNPSTATGGLMVFSSNDIAPTGQLIPISGTNLLVLQSIDSQGQVIQPNSVILAGQQQILPKPIEIMKMGTSQSKSSGKQYHCPHSDCPKIAPTSSKLKLHMLTHTGERPHKCPLDGCDWAFTTAYKLKRHIRGHTGERPFVCDFHDCGKCFTTTYNLKTHQKAHIREQDNVCSSEDCGQTFSTLHKLKVHEKKHQLENELHICTFAGCGKQFKSLSNYNAHFKTHNGERPHACTTEGCGKRFTKASKLKLHMRTHTGERPFVCEAEGCDWSFTSAYKLKRHMRKHTGERPFTCDFAGCGKSFTRASHMRTHALSHTGQKPYICPLRDCLKGFTAASSLNIHMRKHSGDKPFKCTVEGCGKAYTTSANLRLHQKRHEEKALNQEEAMAKEDQVATDHPGPVRYVEIGGVNSVVDTDANPVPSTPYSVMHTFTGEDFGSEDVTSLTVVQFSSEETFPPQTPVSTIDSSNGICFQFSSNDAYTTVANGNAASSISGLSFTAGTPLPSPGAHYAQSNMGEEEVEAAVVMETNTTERQFLEKCSRNDSCPDETTGDRTREFIVRGQSVPRGLNSGEKEDEDLTLPTMVVFTPSGAPSGSPSIRAANDAEARSPEDSRRSDGNISHLTLERPCENSAIDQFAPPAIIFQGEEVKTHDGEVKITYSSSEEHARLKETVRTDALLPVPCTAPATRPANLLHVANLNLNLSSLAHEIDKSPGTPFIGDDVDQTLEHESTINLQDLR